MEDFNFNDSLLRTDKKCREKNRTGNFLRCLIRVMRLFFGLHNGPLRLTCNILKHVQMCQKPDLSAVNNSLTALQAFRKNSSLGSCLGYMTTDNQI